MARKLTTAAATMVTMKATDLKELAEALGHLADDVRRSADTITASAAVVRTRALAVAESPGTDPDAATALRDAAMPLHRHLMELLELARLVTPRKDLVAMDMVALGAAVALGKEPER